MTEFKELIGQKVEKLYLIIWPPFGEQKISDIDVSFGFIFQNNNNKLCVISVDKDELWFPHILYQSLPQNEYDGGDYNQRIKMWMKGEDDNFIIDKEYYDVTKCEMFENIIGSEIIDIELLFIEHNVEPFGIKLIFNNNYIISMPNSDGNTVETKVFNKNNGIETFKHLGNVIYSKLD